MNFKGLLKNIGKAFIDYGPLAVGVATAVLPPGKVTVMPIIGTIINAIGSARLKGGTGEEQFMAALENLKIATPYIIQDVESIFGIDIPEEAVEPYIKGMIQLHYDLLKSAGKIAPSK